MFKASDACSVLLLLAVAGCMSSPAPRSARPPNWSGDSTSWSSYEAPSVPGIAEKGGEAGEPFHGETWVPLFRWAQFNGFSVPERVVFRGVPAWQLTGAGGTVQLRPGNIVCTWEGIEVHLGFAPQSVGGQPYVHLLDAKKTLQPLLMQHRSELLSGTPLVVIDPGHGGEDPGTLNVNGGLHEKHLALDWALRLQKLLLAAGWRASLTRSNDVSLSIPDRVAITDQVRGTVFVSLHFNSAAPNTALAGVETYCLTPTGTSSHLTRGYFDGPEQTFPNNAFDLENLQLACRVHKALLGLQGNRDRGVRRARFMGVLRPQQRPAILIEGGYLSNPDEARRISQPAYRQMLAEAVAQALLSSAPSNLRLSGPVAPKP